MMEDQVAGIRAKSAALSSTIVNTGSFAALGLQLLIFRLFFFLVFSLRDFVLYRCAGRAGGQVSAARLQHRRSQHER